MTREQFDSLDKEQQEEVLNVLLSETEPKGIMMHFKPSYNFQTVEFDMEVSEDNLAEVEEALNLAIRLMMDTAPEQPDTKKPVKKSAPPATRKQKALLKKLGINFDEDITIKEAGSLLDEWYGNE